MPMLLVPVDTDSGPETISLPSMFTSSSLDPAWFAKTQAAMMARQIRAKPPQRGPVQRFSMVQSERVWSASVVLEKSREAVCWGVVWCGDP